jgi:RNA polymerase sigma factor (TIGR02999 family)
MSAESQVAVTDLLHAAGQGDGGAEERLFDVVYGELRRLAHLVRQGRPNETLNTTALVHEAYMKLTPSRGLDVNDRAHFFRIAARAMRQVLSNAARSKAAIKRGAGEAAVSFDERMHGSTATPEAVLDVHEALNRLAEIDQRKADVVECRFFAGLSVEETALALGISEPTVKRDWRAARAWLTDALRHPDAE